jgi:adenylyltransferase/sulfurtransferase
VSEERYSGLTRLEWVGEAGRGRVRNSSCVVIGCGALGCSSSNLLVRYGFGSVSIVDRDFVELPNLERQTLFNEDDAAVMKPKAIAAAERLSIVNTESKVTGEVADVNPGNIERMIGGASIVVDGTDNLETRYLINDACVKNGIPWVYGACLSSAGMTFNVLPGGPCFRCMYAVAPEPGRTPTCETEGILASVPQIVGAIQAAEAVKIVCKSGNISKHLIYIDVAAASFESISVKRSETCLTCGKGEFEYLNKGRASAAISLCGRNAVQILPAGEAAIDLKALEEKLKIAGEVSYKGYLLDFKKGGHELVIFPDGRAIVRGTSDIGVAKSLYARYLGN